jgi:NAD(P)-dependent dehydrogenase (short-subunit alcohol dehydrogenase family)
MKSVWDGKVVLLTGASRGIGREMAVRLAAAGARLVLMARGRGDLEDVATGCESAGAGVVLAPGDVSAEADCREAVRQALSVFGRLDALIANAGVSMLASFEDLTDPGPLDRVMRVNYLGTVYCAHHALPHLIPVRGRIVGVASLAALNGVPTRTGYAASKHAVRGFLDSLRIEVRRHGVSVTVAYPGFVDTGIRERAIGSGSGRAPGRVMGAGECAERILSAAARRRREEVMTLKGKAGRWLKLVAPVLVDRMAASAVGFPYPGKAGERASAR